jgi:hypothetical protein
MVLGLLEIGRQLLLHQLLPQENVLVLQENSITEVLVQYKHVELKVLLPKLAQPELSKKNKTLIN